MIQTKRRLLKHFCAIAIGLFVISCYMQTFINPGSTVDDFATKFHSSIKNATVIKPDEANRVKERVTSKEKPFTEKPSSKNIDDSIHIISEGSVNIFGEEQFHDWLDFNAKNKRGTCIITRTKPSFEICVHDTADDHFISSSILSMGVWELHINGLLTECLENYRDAVLIDLGANLGMHSLFGAKMGHSVWAVEPLTLNLGKMYVSALRSDILGRMHFVQNAVDMERHEVVMESHSDNIGGSFVQTGETQDMNNERVEAILLKDIVEAVKADERGKAEKPHKLVFKIDIETFECRALLGSRSIFSDEDIFIPYIIMEWHFIQSTADGKLVANENCPMPMLRNMTELLTTSGFRPHSAGDKLLKRLDPSDSHKWAPMDVIWIHKRAKQISSLKLIYSEISQLWA